MGKKAFLFWCTLTLFWLKAASQQYLTLPPAPVPIVKKMAPLPQNFYTSHLSFFCKKEDQLQQRTGLNLFFRLGSKEYVDYLEQKPNARGNLKMW